MYYHRYCRVYMMPYHVVLIQTFTIQMQPHSLFTEKTDVTTHFLMLSYRWVNLPYQIAELKHFEVQF
jgi:hypothetical protein